MTGGRGLSDGIPPFVFTALPYRVVFGTGNLTTVATEVERLGRSRALLLATPELGGVGDCVAEALGATCVARFEGATMHTPTDVTARALAVLLNVNADVVVAVGGGSTTGLAKALAYRTGVDQVILPTTYAGSEVTPVLGETENGVKTTLSHSSVLPETVIYDVELTKGLPIGMSVTSAVNALAHAVEALYSPQADPVVDGWAASSINHLARGIRRISDAPDDLGVRSELLYGAWLAGTCLGAAGMGLHHKLCHVLGGSFNLPHAPTHTVVLSHVIAYNAVAAASALSRAAAALGAQDPAAEVFALVAKADVPQSLRELGLREDDLEAVADLVGAATYPNPRPFERPAILGLLGDAWAGNPPTRR